MAGRQRSSASRSDGPASGLVNESEPDSRLLRGPDLFGRGRNCDLELPSYLFLARRRCSAADQLLEPIQLGGDACRERSRAKGWGKHAPGVGLDFPIDLPE